MSRKKFFTVFKEAMLVAAEVIDEGCETVPLPEKLFSLIQVEEESEVWSSSDSESSSSSLEINYEDCDNISCIEIAHNEKRRRFLLPAEACTCDKYDLASVDSIPESDFPSEKPIVEEESKVLQVEVEEEITEEIKQEDDYEQEEPLKDTPFYQPDLKVPSRFLIQPEEDLEDDEKAEEAKVEKYMCKIINNVYAEENDVYQTEQSDQDRYHVSAVTEQFSMKRTSEVSSGTESTDEATESSTPKSEAISNNSQSHKTSIQGSEHKFYERESLMERYKDKQALKGLAFQKLWEQRLKDMKNPRKGWISTTNEGKTRTPVEYSEKVAGGEVVVEETSEEDDVADDDEWVDVVLEKQKHQVQIDEDKLVVNFGVLRAIIDFVFKYFYESFQFSLIKLAFQATPEIISQKLNRQWRIPKKIKGELQKPKVEQANAKKEKATKDKKGKAPKTDKSKKDKGKKGGKKDKKKDKGGKKKDKKGKKAKPVKLTKEEKAELERKRLEQARIEEELRKLEENKRFMFPLADAATDGLYKEIFDNWVKMDLNKKVKEGKGKGKGKKGKK